MKRALAAVVCLTALAACLRPSEPVPKPLREYLEAVKRGDYQAAYSRTQLDEIAANSGSGASLDYEHFAGFFKRSPLKKYEVRHVARLEQHPIENPNGPGTPFFEVEVDMTYADGTHRETFTMEGEIVARVTVEPDRVLLRTSYKGAAIEVDGVGTQLGKAQRYQGVADPLFALLVLQGPHEIVLGDTRVGFSTTPLRAMSGPASVVGSGDNAYLRIG